MARDNLVSISFIGFGEVGRRFAADLRRRDDVSLRAFDILLDDPMRADGIRDAAGGNGVAIAASLADACCSEIVISAVTADQAEAVAAVAAHHLGPGQWFVDVNSASPATKRRAATLVAASGAHYIEAAVMAAVAKPGLQVPILAGGPGAVAAAARLNALGMNLTPVAVDYGRASAIKLSRSIMIKGMEALIVDSAQAARRWGVEADVFASLGASYPAIDWAELADAMAERVATHGVRRSAEMHEAAAMLAELDLDPALARAVAEAQRRGAKPKSKL